MGKPHDVLMVVFFELPNFSKDYDTDREFNLYIFILGVLYTSLLYLLKIPIHLIINCQLINHYQESFFPIELQTVYIWYYAIYIWHYVKAHHFERTIFILVRNIYQRLDTKLQNIDLQCSSFC